MTDTRLIDIWPTEVSENEIADMVRLADMLGSKFRTSAAETLAMTVLSASNGGPTLDCPATTILTVLSINASETKLNDEQLQHVLGCDAWCKNLIILPRFMYAAWQFGQVSGETFREVLDRYTEAVLSNPYPLPECLELEEFNAINAGGIPTPEQRAHIDDCPKWCGAQVKIQQ